MAWQEDDVVNAGGKWEDFNGTEEVVAGNPSVLTDGQAVEGSKHGG